jgi:cyclase
MTAPGISLSLSGSIIRALMVTSLCSCLAVPAAWGQDLAPVELEIVKINDDMYTITNPFVPGNATALVTEEGILLVDDKFEANYDRIVELLATVTDQPVRYVVNTHYHSDHSGGNVKFQQAQAEVFASENARVRMIANDQPGLPNVTVDDNASIYIGGKTVEMHHMGRSHTDGDVVVLFSDYGVLAAGDMFTFGDAVPILIDYAGGGSVVAWTDTIDRILELDFDTVVPGHGAVTTRDELVNFRDGTIAMRDRIAALLAEGSTRDEVEAIMRDDYLWIDLHVTRGLDGLIEEMGR